MFIIYTHTSLLRYINKKYCMQLTVLWYRVKKAFFYFRQTVKVEIFQLSPSHTISRFAKTNVFFVM
jgi:hypothetical protein